MIPRSLLRGEFILFMEEMFTDKGNLTVGNIALRNMHLGRWK